MYFIYKKYKCTSKYLKVILFKLALDLIIPIQQPDFVNLSSES